MKVIFITKGWDFHNFGCGWARFFVWKTRLYSTTRLLLVWISKLIFSLCISIKTEKSRQVQQWEMKKNSKCAKKVVERLKAIIFNRNHLFIFITGQSSHRSAIFYALKHDTLINLIIAVAYCCCCWNAWTK